MCPSCSQKRTLLFGEYANERLLLRLPHRQIVFTFPKVLRHFFRPEHSLHGQVSRLVYRLMQDACSLAAGRPVQGAAVIVFASAGDFVRYDPISMPSSWKAVSGRDSCHILPSPRGLGPSIARPPISLAKMLVEQQHSSVLYRSEYNPCFKTHNRLFTAVEFLVQLLQHLPDPRTHLIRRYGLYSSRSRGTWARKPWLLRQAPEGWLQQHAQQPPAFGAGAGVQR